MEKLHLDRFFERVVPELGKAGYAVISPELARALVEDKRLELKLFGKRRGLRLDDRCPEHVVLVFSSHGPAFGVVDLRDKESTCPSKMLSKKN